MRERRVGRVALPARLVAGAAGAAFLVTAASPAYAQDEESGGGEVLCDLHDPRLANPAGITAADDGWWIVPSAENQNETLSILRVGGDCNVREADEAWIEHQPRDPQALAIDAGGFMWVGDTGDATNRDWITLNQINLDDFSDNVPYRYVFPDGPEEVEAFLLLPGDEKKPLFVTANEGEATLYSPPGENQSENTPMESVGTVALSEGGSVTGAALNADGTKAALRTENAVYEWTVEGGDVVAALTGAEPLVTPIESAGSPEGLSYGADGNFNVLSSADGADGTFGTITSYTPAAPAAEETTGEEGGGDAAAEEEGPTLVDRILDLGFGTIVKILAAIAILGLLVMIMGIVVIRKHKKAQGEEADDGTEEGFAAEESGFGKDESFIADDPVELGLDAGQPDPDLGQVARGNVYGGARSEPSGNVYGGGGGAAARPEPSGNVYGAKPRPESSGSVYGGAARPPEPPASPRRPEPPASPPRRPEASGAVYGGAREEPQYGAFENGGHGSVYDNAGPGQSFTARPEPTGSVYGAKPRPAPSGGSGSQGSVYGAGSGERTPDPDEGYWGPPDNGGSTYGRGR
jgi:hypothetical protein